MKGQISLFDLEPQNFNAGKWIEKANVGRQLSFDEITQRIGPAYSYGYEYRAP